MPLSVDITHPHYSLKVYEHYLAPFLWRLLGRLPVTRVGGFAWTEWELHNRLCRASVWLSAAVPNKNQPHKSVMEAFLSMWLTMIRWLCFSWSRWASVMLTHCIIVNVTAGMALIFLAVRPGLQFATERSIIERLWRVAVLSKQRYILSWTPPPHPESLPEAEHPSFLAVDECSLVTERRRLLKFVRYSTQQSTQIRDLKSVG